MTFYKLSREGYIKLSDEVGLLQEKVNSAGTDPEEAAKVLGEIRLGLFRLNQLINARDDFIPIGPTRSPLGPSAA